MFDPSGLSDGDLENAIMRVAGNLHAGMARFLRLVGEFDARRGWARWGAKSCSDWLAWRCGVSPAAAREQLRVARALPRFPLIRAAFARGELSYSKVRAITRIATKGTEQQLVDWAMYSTASQLDRLARNVRNAERVADPAQRRKSRSLTYYHDDDGCLVIRARLEPEEGAIVLRALERAAKQLDAERSNDASANPPADASAEANAEDASAAGASAEASRGADDPEPWLSEPDTPPPWAQRAADALTVVAEGFLGSPARGVSGPDRALIVIHTDPATLKDGTGQRCTLANGPSLNEETLRRLACDASIVRIEDDVNGQPHSIGRRSRIVPVAMRRRLHHRDRGCRFPSCSSRRCDAHHIQHWGRGGPTSLVNLVSLCRRHHRFVHEQGFIVEKQDGDFLFRTPDGTPITTTAPPRGDPAALEREEISRSA